MTEISTNAPTPAGHRTLGSLLRRGWPFLVIGIIAGLAVGALALSTMTKQYSALASVAVTPTGVNDATTVANSRTGATINLDTEAKVVMSDAVIAQVRKVRTLDPSAKTMSNADLTKPVTIVVPPNSSILQIGYSDSSATVARIRANAFALGYLRARGATAEATLSDETATSQRLLTTVTAQYKSVSATIEKLDKNSTQLPALKSQRSLLLGQIKQLTRDVTAYSTTTVTPGRVLNFATTPSSPSSPSKVLWLSGGLAVGLLLGLLGAWIRSAVHSRLRHRDDVARALQLPVLADVPASSARAVFDEEQEVPDIYRRLATVLLATGTEPGVLLVTGQCSRPALASVTANLAAAIASTDRAVVVSSTDANGVLATHLADDVTSFGIAVAQLPSAMPARAPLDDARGHGWMIVAGVDPAHNAQVQAVGLVSDIVVLVVESGSKTHTSTGVIEQLDTVGAPLLGVVKVPSARWWGRLSATHLRTAERTASRVPADRPAAAGSTPADRSAGGAREVTKVVHTPRLEGDATEESAQPGIAHRS